MLWHRQSGHWYGGALDQEPADASSLLSPSLRRLSISGRSSLSLLFWDPKAALRWEFWGTVRQLEKLTCITIATLRDETFADDLVKLLSALPACLPAACQLCAIEPSFSFLSDRILQDLIKVMDNMDRRFIIMTRNRRTGHSRQVTYLDVRKECKTLVEYTTSPAQGIEHEWDGSRSAKGELDYWDIGMEVSKRAADGSKAEDWEI